MLSSSVSTYMDIGFCTLTFDMGDKEEKELAEGGGIYLQSFVYFKVALAMSDIVFVCFLFFFLFPKLV